jgi:hypothetical protein
VYRVSQVRPGYNEKPSLFNTRKLFKSLKRGQFRIKRAAFNSLKDKPSKESLDADP